MLKWLCIAKENLGAAKSPHIVTSSSLFAIILFFYLLNLASVFQPTVYPLIDRVTYITEFSDKHFTNSLIDHVVIVIFTLLWFQFSLKRNIKKYFFITIYTAIFCLSLYLNTDVLEKTMVSISFPVILSLIIANRFLESSFLSFDWRLSVNYISLIGIILAILSAILVISYVLFPSYSLPSLNFLYYFYLIFAIFSPVYLIIIAFNYPIIMIYQKIKQRRIRTLVNKENNIVIERKKARRITRIMHLLIIMFLSVFIVLIPHMGTINTTDQIIGVDTPNYSKYLESLTQSSGFEELFYNAFVVNTNGDRPLTFLLLLALSAVFSQSSHLLLIENLPILLGPLLLLSVYFLTWFITRNHYTSIIACIITIPSHILIGVYGGLFANWFSLIWSYLAILFLFKILDEPKRVYYFIFSSLLVTLIFSHTPTWNILLYAIGLFLVITFLLNKRCDKKKYLYIIFSILPSILADLVRLILIDTSGVKQEIAFAMQRDVGFYGLQAIWENLVATAHFTLGGQVGNPIILLLVVYWFFSIKIKERYEIFFIIFFSLYLLPFLFGDQQIQSRFLYEVPLQIPAAIALTLIKERVGSYMPLAICLWLIAMSTYMAANFVLIYH